MIWSLQVLRFIAALMVVSHHAADTAIRATGSNGFISHGLFWVGESGVDIFFVISGVIITKIARGRSPSEFIRSRLTRIVPMYLICTAPALSVAISTGFGWRDALATFLFWPATDRMTLPILFVGWTLCFEMLFYFSATLVLVSRHWLFVIIAAYAAALLFRSVNPIFQFLGHPITLEFFFGVIIACAPAWRPGFLAMPLGFVALALLGLIGTPPASGALDTLYGNEAFWRVLVYGLPATMIVYGTLQAQVGKSVLTYLGDASYSLYLTHTLPLTALLVLWRIHPVPANLIILIGIVAALLFAWRMHERFEKPIQAYMSLGLKIAAVKDPVAQDRAIPLKTMGHARERNKDRGITGFLDRIKSIEARIGHRPRDTASFRRRLAPQEQREQNRRALGIYREHCINRD
jgi:exopolysaccharide production protein ExoZ